MSSIRKVSNTGKFIEALDNADLLVSVVPRQYINKEIKSVTFNSLDAELSCLFVCKGIHFKEIYLEDALRNGASAYVSETPYHIGTEDHPEIIVSDIRRAMAVIAETFYGSLSDELKVVGITGTKGKTTTAYFVRYIIDDYIRTKKGVRAPGTAICSGIINYDGVIEEPSHLTTPEVFELYQHMNNAVNSGIEHLVMEVSSQSLKYNRVDGVEFEAGAFLNIGSDHISEAEHKDFDDYLESKLLLFGRCRKACYNLDCEEQARIAEASKNCSDVITFSKNNQDANVFAYDICSSNGSVRFKVRTQGIEKYSPDFDAEFILGTFGTIFVENALAAISLSILIGVPLEYIQSGLAKAVSPGRMEVIRRCGGKRIAIVDYAHNQLSFEKLFETVREEFPGSRTIIVFGCSGGKAFPRREDLGTIAGRNAWRSIVTEDDPGEEDVNEICSEIAGYVDAAGGEYEIITNRTDAIRRAVELMDDNTILLLAGKGHETSIKRGTEYFEVLSDGDTFISFTEE